jgi:rRNA-processing protein FCF1
MARLAARLAVGYVHILRQFSAVVPQCVAAACLSVARKQEEAAKATEEKQVAQAEQERLQVELTQREAAEQQVSDSGCFGPATFCCDRCGSALEPL